MTPEQIGFIVGVALVVVLLPIAILVAGYRFSRHQAPAEREKTLKRVHVATTIATVGLTMLGVVLLITELRSGANIEQIRAGMTRGCTARCVKRASKAAECQRMCACVTNRFIREVGEKRLTSMSGPTDLTPQDRAKLISAALHCRRTLQPVTK